MEEERERKAFGHKLCREWHAARYTRVMKECECECKKNGQGKRIKSRLKQEPANSWIRFRRVTGWSEEERERDFGC